MNGISFNGMPSFTDANPQYQEILKLDRWLTIAGVSHQTDRILDGWDISYTMDGKAVSYAAEHLLSDGQETDLLEFWGFDYLTRDHHIEQLPTHYGNQTALGIFALWSADYRRSSPQYKAGRYMAAWKDILVTSVSDKAEKHADFRTSYYESKKKNGTMFIEAVRNPEQAGGNLLIETAVLAVMFGDTDFIEKLTGCQARKHLISYILDELILTAIHQKHYDIQLMLTDYKNKNHLYREKQFRI